MYLWCKNCSLSLLLPQLCHFCVSSMVQHGMQIIQVEDKTTVINNTPYQIFYKPQLSVSNPHSGKEVSNPQCGCSLWFYQFTINRLNLFLAWGKEKANSEYRNPVISAGFEPSNGKLKFPQWEVSRMLQQHLLSGTSVVLMLLSITHYTVVAPECECEHVRAWVEAEPLAHHVLILATSWKHKVRVS